MIETAHDAQPVEAEMPVDPNHVGIAQRQIRRRSDITQAGKTDAEQDAYEYSFDEALQANGARKYNAGIEPSNNAAPAHSGTPSRIGALTLRKALPPTAST